MTQVNTFDGGLSTRIDPSLIKANEATRLINVNPDPVVLCSAKNYSSIGQAAGSNFYNFQGAWIEANTPRDYIEYEGKVYFTDDNQGPQVFDGTDFNNLGIAAPVAIPAVDGAGDPILNQLGEQYNGLAASVQPFSASELSYTLTGITRTNGQLSAGTTYNYKFTIVNDNDNVFEISENITLTSGQNAVRFDVLKNAGLTVRIYREHLGIFEQLTQFNLTQDRAIIDQTFDLSANNDFTNIVSNLQGVLQYTLTYYNVNTGVESAPMEFSSEVTVNLGDLITVTNIPIPTDPQVTHKRLYRIGGNLNTMSLVAELPIGQTTYSDYTSDIEITDILTSINHTLPDPNLHSLTEAYSTFFGLVGNELKFSEIDEPDVWPLENSIKLRKTATGLLPIPQGMLVFTETDTYLLTGTNRAEFNLLFVTNRQGCISHKSCQVVKNTPLWVSYDGVCTLQNGYVQVLSKPLLGRFRIDVLQTTVYDEQYFILKTDGTFLVLDTRSGFRFYNLEFAEPISGIGTFNGELYFSVNGELQQAFTGELLTLKYTSPIFIESNHADRRMYNHFYIRSDGDFIVKIFINEQLVLTQSITGYESHDLTPPKAKQRGLNCYVEIEGIGKVYTIDTKPKGRNNGR